MTLRVTRTAISKYPVYDEETGDTKLLAVCWDCDFELANGRGDGSEEPWKILMGRAEEDYEYDPLYYPKPSWYP